MNLLSMLSKVLLSDATLKVITSKTGLDVKTLRSLIEKALPTLLSSLTANASSADGAASLLSALSGHTSTKAISEQVAEADTDDGAKILSHILGDSQQDVIAGLAAETGITTDQTSQVLNNIAPALLTGVSNAASSLSSAKVDLSDGIDLSDVMGLLGGAQESGGLLSKLFGKKGQESTNSAANGMDLLSSLLDFPDGGVVRGI